MAVMYGPIQMMVIGFEGNKFKGEIVPELKRLKDQGLLRLIDYMFVMKDKDGSIAAFEGTDLGKDEVVKFGAAVGALFGLGATGSAEGAIAGAEVGAEEAERQFGFTIEDLEQVAEEIPNNSSALIMLVEHLWAKKLKEVLRNADAAILAQGLLQPEAVVLMGAALGEARREKAKAK